MRDDVLWRALLVLFGCGLSLAWLVRSGERWLAATGVVAVAGVLLLGGAWLLREVPPQARRSLLRGARRDGHLAVRLVAAAVALGCLLVLLVVAAAQIGGG